MCPCISQCNYKYLLRDILYVYIIYVCTHLCIAVPGIPGMGIPESGKSEAGNAEPGKLGLGACLTVFQHISKYCYKSTFTQTFCCVVYLYMLFMKTDA